MANFIKVMRSKIKLTYCQINDFLDSFGELLGSNFDQQAAVSLMKFLAIIIIHSLSITNLVANHKPWQIEE